MGCVKNVDFRFRFSNIDEFSLVFSEVRFSFEFMNLKTPDFSWISFVLDRLLFDEKKVLLYCVLSYLHGDITISDEETLHTIESYLVPFFEPLFLYYDNDTYSYRPKYEKKYKKQLVGITNIIIKHHLMDYDYQPHPF